MLPTPALSPSKARGRGSPRHLKERLMRCPCRKKTESVTYAACCEPYHRGDAVPVTAETLMRSRYSGFVLKRADYILATWHRSTRPPFVNMVADETWLSLKVGDSTMDGDTATVTFTARSLIKGQSQVMHEVSRFVRESGRWFYVRDDARPEPRVPAKS